MKLITGTAEKEAQKFHQFFNVQLLYILYSVFHFVHKIYIIYFLR